MNDLKEPYEFCRKCGGEGKDYDTLGLFDFPCFYECEECSKWEEYDTAKEVKEDDT